MSEKPEFPLLQMGTHKLHRISGDTPGTLVKECCECNATFLGKPTILFTRNDIRVGIECPNCGTDNIVLQGKVTYLKCEPYKNPVNT